MSEYSESLHSEGEELKQLIAAMYQSTKAIAAQTEAITRLANSNAMIAQALAEQIDDEEDKPATGYLDGSPLG